MPESNDRPRSFFERNAAALIIAFVFGTIALMVIAKRACG